MFTYINRHREPAGEGNGLKIRRGELRVGSIPTRCNLLTFNKFKVCSKIIK